MNISPDNIQLQIASLRGDIVSTLIGAANGEEAASFADILGTKTSALSADGHNMSLRDPDSAFQMMSQINQFEVDFKAQYATLDEMGAAIEQMEAAGRQLGNAVEANTANADIVAQMQSFVDQYNAWEDRFDDTVAQGGVLDNVQAAEVSLYELEQSVQNIFNGAEAGISGLPGLGITIDPVTKQASLDVSRLEAVLDSNKAGVVSTIDAFSANFATSADLLNAEDNFIQNALDNRSRAIDYIAGNRASLQTEFGTGESARPAGDVAKALAAYENAFGIA